MIYSFLYGFGWLVVLGLKALWDNISVYIGPSPKEREKEENGQMIVKMSKQPPPAPTASAIGPCPAVIKIVGCPGTGSLPSTIAPPDHPLFVWNLPKKSIRWSTTQHLAVCQICCWLVVLGLTALWDNISVYIRRGWSGGAKVLGKLPVLGRPTNLDYSRARACCACSRCGWGLFGHFFSHLSFLSSFSLSLGDGPI